MEAIKNCPFCGSKAEDGYEAAYSVDSGYDYIGCTSERCGAHIPYNDRYAEARASAIARWNRRAASSRTE